MVAPLSLFHHTAPTKRCDDYCYMLLDSFGYILDAEPAPEVAQGGFLAGEEDADTVDTCG